MSSYKNFLNEVLITFGGQAYPKFNQIVLLAGGAGSGKGFISSNLLGIEGKTIDVDKFKQFIIKSDVIAKKIFSRNKILKLERPEDVYTLHIICKYLGIEGKFKTALQNGIEPESMRKPNLIFDTTLKDSDKLKEVSAFAQSMGYKKEDIHIVWVLNDLEIAKKQNAKRERVVPEEILISTHKGARTTMSEIFNKTIDLKTFMDGDIHIAFNRKGIDSDLSVSGRGGKYLKNAAYATIKRKGKSISQKTMTKDLINKLNSLTKTDIF